MLNTQSDPDIRRQQKLAACQIAYDAIECNDMGPLHWFTADVLGLPRPWAPYTAMALWQTAWRQADNPFGWLRVVAARAVKRWNPALIGQSWKEREHRAVLATDLGEVHANDGYAYREGAAGALAFHAHLAEDGGIIARGGKFMAGAGHRRNGRRWRNPVSPNPPKKKRGENRLGPDDYALIGARLAGYTRQTAGAHLGWSQSKVERIWRRINRDQNRN